MTRQRFSVNQLIPKRVPGRFKTVEKRFFGEGGIQKASRRVPKGSRQIQNGSIRFLGIRERPTAGSRQVHNRFGNPRKAQEGSRQIQKASRQIQNGSIRFLGIPETPRSAAVCFRGPQIALFESDGILLDPRARQKRIWVPTVSRRARPAGWGILPSGHVTRSRDPPEIFCQSINSEKGPRQIQNG